CGDASFTAAANTRTGPDSTRTLVLPRSVPLSSVRAATVRLPPESHARHAGATLPEHLTLAGGDGLDRPPFTLLDLTRQRPTVHPVQAAAEHDEDLSRHA